MIEACDMTLFDPVEAKAMFDLYNECGYTIRMIAKAFRRRPTDVNQLLTHNYGLRTEWRPGQ